MNFLRMILLLKNRRKEKYRGLHTMVSILVIHIFALIT